MPVKFKIFNISMYDNDEEVEKVNKFIAGHNIIDVEKHFSVDTGKNLWSFCITYNDQIQGSDGNYKKKKVDYRNILNEKEFAAYVKIRNLRKTLAEKEGVPVYALFNNEQIADMVRGRIVSRNQLLTVSYDVDKIFYRVHINDHPNDHPHPENHPNRHQKCVRIGKKV